MEYNINKPLLKRLARLLIPVFFIVVLLVTVALPIVIALMWSFVDPNVGWDYKTVFPSSFSFAHWLNIIQNTGIGKAVANSYFIAICTTLLCFVLSVPTAYALGRKNVGNKDFYKIVMMLPLMLPGMAIALFLGRIMITLGFSQNILGVIIGHTFLCIPYMLRIMTVSFEAVPQDLIDAAENLGARRVSKFFEVYFPLVLPGLFAGAIFTMINSLEEFTIAFIIGVPKIQTVTTILYSYLGANLIKTSSSVASLILIVPNVILLLICEKYIKMEYVGAALGKL